jgi:hypothetical protein
MSERKQGRGVIVAVLADSIQQGEGDLGDISIKRAMFLSFSQHFFYEYNKN